MNGPNGRYFPVLVIYENPDVPNVESLEVNGPNPEFIVFSDSSGSGRGSVDSSELQQSGFQKGGFPSFLLYHILYIFICIYRVSR